jgi:hypothetical protein
VLILHFEPPQKEGSPLTPAGPVAWTDRVRQALYLPGALREFLAGPLSLTTAADLPAVLGVRLEASKDLTELIDVTGLTALRGGTRKRQAIGYFIGNRHGERWRTGSGPLTISGTSTTWGPEVEETDSRSALPRRRRAG